MKLHFEIAFCIWNYIFMQSQPKHLVILVWRKKDLEYLKIIRYFLIKKNKFNIHLFIYGYCVI